jgi:hypothetical protein
VANLVQKANIAFVKGLITEAGELTFPDNASVDELNCDLSRDGSRRRRKGIRYEDNFAFSDFDVFENTVLSFGNWLNVGNDANRNYLVVQAGSTLHFYEKNRVPYSNRKVAQSISLIPFEVPGSQGSALVKCAYTSMLGNLVVVSPAIEPFYIEEVDGTLVANKVECRVRDFEWIGDRREYDVPEPSPTSLRKYDTANSGWSTPLGRGALQSYIAARGAWPPLTHPWYSGKDSNGNFSVTEWEKVYSGTSLGGNGHYILPLFAKNRGEAAQNNSVPATGGGGLIPGYLIGAPGPVPDIGPVPTEFEFTRFQSVEAFSGRVFFSGLTSAKNSGKIYFSRSLESIRDVGEFFQLNDPTSEDIADAGDADGGVINIPDAISIRKLFAFRNSIFVFAENGVWQIKGVDDVFTPTAFSVNKVSSVGIVTSESFVEAEGIPFWWSRFGIHTLRFDETGSAGEENISISTIQEFWNKIDFTSKSKVKAEYDRINKKILWLYPNNGETVVNKYNNLLVLDVTLQAFYPWKIEDRPSAPEYILGFSFYPGFGIDEALFEVVGDPGEFVKVNDEQVVATYQAPFLNSSASIIFFVRDVQSNKATMATLTGEDFLDWGEADFSSYAETGYDFLGDLAARKYAPYVVFYLRETETGWSGNDTLGYNPVNPSSMFVTCYWDFNKIPSSAPQQAYLRRQPILVDGPAFNSPATVVSHKLKVRGNGRSLRIRMESETGKDFVYLGHGLIADVTSRF